MGVRNVDPGNVVHASDQQAIATLVLTQPTNVLFTLPAQTLEDVRAAQARGEVQVLAYDRDNKKLLSTGTLATVDNVIDQTTASYRLKAVFANARLLVDVTKSALVIPDGAIQHGPQGLFVWAIGSDNKAAVRPIKVAQSADGNTIVTAGLTAGERVATGGQYKLIPNASVTVGSDTLADARSDI